MSPLESLLKSLSSSPSLLTVLDLNSCICFIEITRILKPLIALHTLLDEDLPPERLPLYIHAFLANCLGISHTATKLVWDKLRHIAWEQPELTALERHSFGTRYLQKFLDHGLGQGIAFYHFIPREKFCLDPACLRSAESSNRTLCKRRLSESLTVPVTVFTQDFGPVPGLSCSMYCRNCKTRYHPNYWIQGASTASPVRSYYPGSFDFIASADHVYIETRVCELFTTMMVTSWTSASNCAQIYNDGLALKALAPSLPAAYSKSLLLDVEMVWDALCLHWLLEDCFEQETSLELPEKLKSQTKRLEVAMVQRNKRMVGTGQDEWNHACDLCCWINTTVDGAKTQLRSTVTDGVTIGRPCCSVHDCKEPLESVKHRFCQVHKSENNVCCATECRLPVDDGYKTCNIPEHRNLELYLDERNKAMFQLKERLARINSSQPLTAIPSSDTSLPLADEEITVDANGICTDKPATGNHTVRARFGRRRTHNEQLCVASCGCILGRATFYGSEAPNAVVTFWKRLFPTQESLPGVLWHDNNCRIRVMLAAQKDTYFDNVALPVDVFHFKSKHKESDVDCGRYCNPVLWPDLKTPEGGWRFNSSAAEQANAWIGGYQAIVREMQKDKYEFFLDEMIRRRNKVLVKQLEKKGHAPYNIPRNILGV